MQTVIIAGNDTLGGAPLAPQIATASVGGLSLLERAVRAAMYAGSKHIIVVGPDPERLALTLRQPLLDGVRLEWRQLDLPLARAGQALLHCHDALDERFWLLPLNRTVAPGHFPARRWREGGAVLARDARGLLVGPILASAGLLDALRACDADLDRALDALHRRALIADERVTGVWHPVRDLAEQRAAHEALFLALRKPLAAGADGLTAHYLNRPVSIAMSRGLVRTALSPNAVTALTMLIGLLGSGLIASGSWGWMALGGLLHQLASITDGVDGEIARLKLQMSRRGEWFDTLADDVRSVSLIIALGVGAHALFGAPWLLPATALSTLTTLSLLGLRYHDMLRSGLASHNAYSAKGSLMDDLSLWQEVKLLFSYIVKRDSHTLIFAICLAFSMPQVAFALMTFGTGAMLIAQLNFSFNKYLRVRPLSQATGEHALIESRG